MEIVQHSVGYDLYHGYGSSHGDIATYRPRYHERGETASSSPAQCLGYAAGSAVIQGPFPGVFWWQIWHG